MDWKIFSLNKFQREKNQTSSKAHQASHIDVNLIESLASPENGITLNAFESVIESL